jgi:hypothetical protein
MISWVHCALKDWGRAQYWLMFKGDGYPSRSMLGKLLEEGAVGAATNQFTREFPEVLVGENLIVANAVKTLSEKPRAVVSVHYVLRMPARNKYKFMGISREMYYGIVWGAHIQIANAIEAQDVKAKLRLLSQNAKQEVRSLQGEPR